MNTATLHTKLLEVQKEIGAITKDSVNPFFKSKYFDINSLLAVVKPVLNKHGLVITQALSNVDGHLGLTTSVIEASTGIGLESTAVLPDVADAQKAGSAITYFRRYAIQSFLALEAEDDDGNIATHKVAPVKKINKVEDTINADDVPF